jgi:hypothetical protein
MEIITSYFKIILKKIIFRIRLGRIRHHSYPPQPHPQMWLAASTDAAGEDTSDVL